AESVRKFQIGLAIDAWDALLRSPVGKKYTPQQLLMGGLAKAREGGGGHYDVFRNRLMFPIRDENGRVIAFGGRAMPGAQGGARDVILSHQFGVSNVVSVLGTAMTEQHVSTLRRFVDKIVLLFDADAAGDLAVDRVVSLFLTQEIEIAIASMPPGKDPDEYLL